MPSGFNPMLAIILFLFLCAAAVAASKRPSGVWNYYHFDGSRFTEGQTKDGNGFVAVRDGVRPVFLTHPARIKAVGLPSGTGAAAGICYIQVSGGKLTNGAGYLPSSSMRLPISSGNVVVTTVQTDEHGYFFAVLPAGSYIVGDRPLAGEVTVQEHRTSLVAIRVSKRMAD